MNKEYVSKDEAKSALSAAFAFHSYAGPTACAVIDRLPPADVEEKRRWHDLRSDPDDLPEKQGTYLIVTNQGKVVSATYAPNFKKFNGSAGKSATHWQNTPEPPKE